VSLDEALGDGQADTRPAMCPIPGRVNPVEALEDMRKVLRGDAIAGIRNGDCHATGAP